MSTRDLINAIAAGDALEIENAFNSAMAEKVSMRIDDMRISVAQNLFAEDVEELDEEQLDELSNATLSSYAKKKSASHEWPDADDHEDEDQEYKHQAQSMIYKINTHRGLADTSKNTKDQHRNMAKAHDLARDYHAFYGNDHQEKLHKTAMKVHSKLAKEEFNEEQLDEISKKTLGSYVKKASSDAATHNGEVQNIRGWKREWYYDDDETEKHEKKFEKRMKGINKAVDRLSK